MNRETIATTPTTKAKIYLWTLNPINLFLSFPSDWHIAKITTDKKDQHICVEEIQLVYVE